MKLLSYLQTLWLIKGIDCYKPSSSLPLLNNLVLGSLRWYLLQATTPLAPFIKVPSEDESIEGQRAKREWTTCFCHTVRMKEDECKQGKVCVCVVAGLGILCRMGTGGTPDSTGTSHHRIYHSATVTAGQGTDVSVYPRATSDWPSLTLARRALPTQDGASEDRWEEEIKTEKRGRNWRMLSLPPRHISKLAHFSPVCSILHWSTWNSLRPH